MELTLHLNKKIIAKQAMSEDHKVFTELYQLHAHQIYNTVYRILNNSSTAEDIVQEAFCTAFAQRKALRQPEKFGGWVNRIALNKAVDVLRKNKLVFIEEQNTEISVTEPDAEEEIIHQTKIEDIKKAIQSLPDGYRTIITLHLLEDISQEKIALMLNISHSTVRSQYYRAKQRILSILNEKHEEGK